MNLPENTYSYISIKHIAILIVLCLSAAMSYGQNDKMREKIESARIALITERLDLSPKQAEKFWPVYNEFTSRRKELRNTYLSERRNIEPEQLSEEESKQWIQKSIELKQKELDLEKEYSGKMLNVISTRQMLSLRNAENDFRRMLLERINRNRSQQMQREQFRRNQQMRKNRNNN